MTPENLLLNGATISKEDWNKMISNDDLMKNLFNVTQWFSQPPEHVGVYWRNMSTAHENDKILPYSLWNGSYWALSEDSPEEAVMRRCRSLYQNLPWREIVKE